jgi:multidrug efflux pump subunit AcrA (membrane-fusion protein)
MKSNFYTRITGVLVVAVLLGACSAASPDEDKKARLEKLKKEQTDLSKEIQKLEAEIAKEVGVSELAPRKFDQYVQTQGRVESDNNILVSAKAPGVITQLYATEGQQVAKGQVLAQIDNSVIERNIESMQTQLDLAKAVYERQENLWKQKIGTEVQYLQAKTSKERHVQDQGADLRCRRRTVYKSGRKRLTRCSSRANRKCQRS